MGAISGVINGLTGGGGGFPGGGFGGKAGRVPGLLGSSIGGMGGKFGGFPGMMGSAGSGFGNGLLGMIGGFPGMGSGGFPFPGMGGGGGRGDGTFNGWPGQNPFQAPQQTQPAAQQGNMPSLGAAPQGQGGPGGGRGTFANNPFYSGPHPFGDTEQHFNSRNLWGSFTGAPMAGGNRQEGFFDPRVNG